MKSKQMLVLCVGPALWLSGCGGDNSAELKAKQDAQAQAQAQQAGAGYDGYVQQINGLPQVEVKTETEGTFRYATFNAAAHQAASDALRVRIFNDASVSGTASTGQKGQLLALLQTTSSAKTSEARSSVDGINAETERNLYNRLAMGSTALQDADVRGGVIRLKGGDGLKTLMNSQGSDERFSQALASLFPGVARAATPFAGGDEMLRKAEEIRAREPQSQ